MTTLTSTEREHREFSPSRSERFILCPGSVNLLRRTPARERTIYADEGDVAHKVLEAGLTTFAINANQAIENSIYCCEDFDSEFKASINEALSYVWGVMQEVNGKYGDAVLYVETFVNPPVAAAPGEAGGYCDVAIYSAKARHLWVVDYKHGVGIAKAVVGNTQVKQYAAGFLFDENRLVDPESVDDVTLVIVQPRAYHPDGDIREYQTTPGHLWDYLLELEGYIEEALKPDAPLKPGVDQCRFCEARSACPALEARAVAIINPQFNNTRQVTVATLPDPKTMDVQRLSYIKQQFELFRIFMNGVDSHVDELVRSGVHVPGWKMVETNPKRVWYGDENERAYKLASLIGCKPSDLYRTSFKTLTDVEELVVTAFKSRVGKGRKKQAAEEAKQLFAYFTIKESSGNLTLVPEDDPRPAVNKALQSFETIRGAIEPPTINQGEKA